MKGRVVQEQSSAAARQFMEGVKSCSVVCGRGGGHVHAVVVGVCAVHGVGALVRAAGSNIEVLLPAVTVTVVHPPAAQAFRVRLLLVGYELFFCKTRLLPCTARASTQPQNFTTTPQSKKKKNRKTEF